MVNNKVEIIHPYTSFCHAYMYQLICSLGIDKDFSNYAIEIGIFSKCSDKSLLLSAENVHDDVVYVPMEYIMTYDKESQFCLSFILFDIFNRARINPDVSMSSRDIVIRIVQYPLGQQGASFSKDNGGNIMLKLSSPDRVLAVRRLCDLPIENCQSLTEWKQ